MISKAVEYVLLAAAAFLALWWFNDCIEAYYQAPLIESYAEAQRLAKKQTETRAASNDKLKKEAENAKIKQLASNLAAANAATAAADGLRNDLRAGRIASQANISACAQYADTVTEILGTGAAMARRIAAEADGHVADKVACSTAWPK